jgi:hypothetical protein
MTYIPSQPVMIQMTNWEQFKAVVLVQKSLLLNYGEYPTYYDIRAADTERFWILLAKGTAEAADFEANYKDGANVRYDVRTVLVTTDGQPTIDAYGAPMPVGGAAMGVRGTDGTMASLAVDAATGRLLLMPISFSSYTTTSAPSDPVPETVVPADGTWYPLGVVAIGKEGKTICWWWGKL